ncbi:MAG: hypothetical protein IT440_15810, partial [Phycisphaeraceae bacterium]|nr:hypothetical protein [Phycisphaeraceae bacterium]
LLEMAQINAQGGEKKITALHSAVWLDNAAGETSRTAFLMERWADANVQDAGGKSPLDHARALGAKALVDLIEEYKDGPDARRAYLDRKRNAGIKDAFNREGGEEVEAPAQPVFAKKKALVL